MIRPMGGGHGPVAPQVMPLHITMLVIIKARIFKQLYIFYFLNFWNFINNFYKS